jgi:hypothetical protein
VKIGEAALQTLKSAECVAPACTIRSDGGDIVVLVMPKRDLDYIRSCLLDLVRREREADDPDEDDPDEEVRDWLEGDATPGKYL